MIYRRQKLPLRRRPLKTRRGRLRKTRSGRRERRATQRSKSRATYIDCQHDFCPVTQLLTTYREQEAAKKAEAARKKAERDAQLAAEEASLPSGPKNNKTAQKKTRGTLDLSQLDAPADSRKAATLNASGIENALDALSLTASSDTIKVDRHPERRYKAAYAAFEARRLPEIEKEHPGLRKQQRIEICKKEFEKSEENPFNKVNVAFDATREEIAAVREAERKKVEARLAAR